MYIFISYQTADKHVAGEIQNILEAVGIESFLAHEDIEVSVEWRGKILEEIGKANVFISLLSEGYYSSSWCVQESGIAAYRKNMTEIPLSIDGRIPEGFAGNIQSTRIDPEHVSLIDLLPGLIRHDFELGTNLIIEIIGRSGSFRNAEANYSLILPYLENLSEEQIKVLLEKIRANGQIHHAGQCAKEFIPPLLENYGHLLEPEDLKYLKEVCERYA